MTTLIDNIVLGTAGATDIAPRICYIYTRNTVAEVTTTGYLNQAVQNGYSFSDSDMCLVTTRTTPGATSTQVGWYEISRSGANTSLIVPSSSSTIVGNLTVTGSATVGTTITAGTGITSTTGNITATAGSVIAGTTLVGGTGITATTGNITATAGNLVAGSSGAAGTLVSFPATAANGTLIISALNAGGAFNTTIRNSVMGQSTVYSLGDIGAATGGIPVATSVFVMKSVAAAAAAGGNAAQSFSDAFCTSGSMIVANWNTQANAASILKVVPGNGSFVVTSSADAGVGTLNYIITK